MVDFLWTFAVEEMLKKVLKVAGEQNHKIVGRDVEVESIVKQVIDASNNQILPIVGMGGLGKTTLAKLVFNHELVRQHFDKTVWVCVSEPFIINRILLDILPNLKGPISNGDDSKEVLLRKLQKEMLGQTYFLVLDDVWNENPFRVPPHLSQLTQLQTLSHFPIGYEKGCKITELGPLKNLQGSLSLSCLEKVESKEEASGANLAEKENLKELHLNWNMKRKDNHGYNDLEVMEGLQPNQNLQSLTIYYFGERRLPNRIFVENLRKIQLYGCNSCEKLPMLGQLNNLKELEIKGFQALQIIDSEFYGNDPNQKRFFPKLEKFVVRDMINLEQWEEVTINDASSNVISFPNLKCLKIHGCPKLLNIPEVFDENDMQHLFVSLCNKLTKLPSGLHFCSSVRYMRIDRCSNLSIDMRNKPELCLLSIGPLEKLPEDLCHLMNLRGMEIVGNMENYDFGILQHLPSLKQITLVEDELSNNSVTQIPEQLQHLTAIGNFGGIEALPEWFGNFVCLQELSLSNCTNLKKLPSKEAMLRLTKLKELRAYGSLQLHLDEGDMERPKLSHLPEIKIYSYESCS